MLKDDYAFVKYFLMNSAFPDGKTSFHADKLMVSTVKIKFNVNIKAH